MRVLFVCTGNTCRSPMLEFMFRHYLSSLGIADIEVDSAGTMNHEKPMSKCTEAVLAMHAIPHTERLSKHCSKSEVLNADFVITMTDEQAKTLKNLYDTSKIIPMRDISGYDIADPYGNGQGAYEEVYKQLSESLPKILEYIKK